MADMSRSAPLALPAVQPGDFATTFWPAYRAEFLGLERTPWHTVHSVRFFKKHACQGSGTVSRYYEKRFMDQSKSERAAHGWPLSNAKWSTMSQVINAHVFFANLDPHIKAKLLQDHPDVCAPADMDQWQLQKSYAKARDVEQSALLQAEKKQRDEQKQLSKAVNATRTVTTQANTRSSTRNAAGSTSGTGSGTTIDMTDINGTGYRRRSNVREMTRDEWAVFDGMRVAATAKTLVPGWGGTTYTHKA